jgi:capsular exopolysaccharide synthesis family protein
MTRIDEALRRAAQNGPSAGNDADTTQIPEPDFQPDDHEVESLAREPFPIEMANRTPVQPPGKTARFNSPGASQRPGSSRDAGQGPAQTQTQTQTQGPPDKSGSLFERIDHTLAEKVVADRNIAPLSREQYRRLAAALHDAQTNTGLSVIMIASALSGEGKTLTASNLALTLSESYQKRVLLIDADLRKPTLHQVFKINTTLGLTTGLEAGNDAKLTVHQVSPRLSVLPAGRPTSDPMAGLISDRMRQLIDEAKEAFDWVIVDTPPIVLLPDANLLAAMVQATVLVIRAGSTPHSLVKRAVEAIGAPRIIGTVLNQAAPAGMGNYGPYSYYYGSGQYLRPAESESRG